ncbi:hypothetical protein [Streptomyces sp. NPDC020965]|uniref:hypothetical protein n=1 Tax=Streptomyces sp. NPDC020965 TaxID=3365105 RepID=UPI00379270B7
MARRGAGLAPVAVLLPAGLVGGGLWWWAVVRLVWAPERAGLIEGAVAVGGWGLSLLPVHVMAAREAGRSTRAWRRRRSGG